MSKSLREGDLVFINKPESKVLGPLLPVQEAGYGIVVKVKPTKVHPGNRKSMMYKILVGGQLKDIWGDDIKRLNVDT